MEWILIKIKTTMMMMMTTRTEKLCEEIEILSPSLLFLYGHWHYYYRNTNGDVLSMNYTSLGLFQLGLFILGSSLEYKAVNCTEIQNSEIRSSFWHIITSKIEI
jgi:hypothetical protein